MTKQFIIGDGPAILTVRPSRKGKPSRIDGRVIVTIADPSLFTADVIGDGLSVRFYDLGVVGSTEATITADVAIGEAVRTQTLVVGLEAIEGDADRIDGEFGDQQADGSPAVPEGPETPHEG